MKAAVQTMMCKKVTSNRVRSENANEMNGKNKNGKMSKRKERNVEVNMSEQKIKIR